MVRFPKRKGVDPDHMVLVKPCPNGSAANCKSGTGPTEALLFFFPHFGAGHEVRLRSGVDVEVAHLKICCKRKGVGSRVSSVAEWEVTVKPERWESVTAVSRPPFRSLRIVVSG